MPIFDAPRPDAGADDGLDEEPSRQTTSPSGDRSGLRETLPQWLILKRGEARLALFRGWPEPGLARTFRQMAMTIGLALEGRDLGERGRFDDCGYVYIGTHRCHGGAFTDALRDLARAGWTIDQDALAWPVITGGYQPDLSKGPSTLPPPRTAEPENVPTERTSERMEA
ncbi:MAG: hypothetical protein ACR2RA_20745 [Geminicoccaceae bacterium]